jgi:hypothetical protein
MIYQGLADSLKSLSKKKGKKYTDKEAGEAAERLVEFYRLLIKVDKRNKQKEHNKRIES